MVYVYSQKHLRQSIICAEKKKFVLANPNEKDNFGIAD